MKQCWYIIFGQQKKKLYSNKHHKFFHQTEISDLSNNFSCKIETTCWNTSHYIFFRQSSPLDAPSVREGSRFFDIIHRREQGEMANAYTQSTSPWGPTERVRVCNKSKPNVRSCFRVCLQLEEEGACQARATPQKTIRLLTDGDVLMEQWMIMWAKLEFASLVNRGYVLTLAIAKLLDYHATETVICSLVSQRLSYIIVSWQAT